MINDNLILDKMKTVQHDVNHWVNDVEQFENQSAYSDRILEEIIKNMSEVKTLYETNKV